MSDRPAVLDASAPLALLQNAPDAEVVADRLTRRIMRAVNPSEVVAKLVDHGLPEAGLHATLEVLDIDVREFDLEPAYAAGELRRSTRDANLSFSDRTVSPWRCGSAPQR